MADTESSKPMPPSDRAEAPTSDACEDTTLIDQVVEVDAEAYMRWLETGDGPDPCEVAFSE